MIEDKDFENYFSLYEKARELEKIKDTNKALDIYLEILKKFEPMGTAYYERPAIILEKQKRYDEAIKICKKAILSIKEKKFNASADEFEHRLERLKGKLNKPITSSVKKTLSKKSIKNISTNINSTIEVINKEIVFPEWYVSVSFGASKSPNYIQAVTLSKMAPQYIENNINGQILHQAVYSDKASEYLMFIKLYELISSWKSCFVIINGEVVDRKIIGGLNYCYGDKCRSGNPDFCYGASYMTSNPFGCHRLQISACNNPWWTFRYCDNNGIWHADKKSILNRITEYSLPYRQCPAFSMDLIIANLNKLPDILDSDNYSDFDQEECSVEVNLNSLNNDDNKTLSNNNFSLSKTDFNNLNKSTGCLSSILIFVFICVLVFLN